MLFHPLAQRPGELHFLQLRDVRRCGWRWCAENVFQDILPAFHRRGARGIRGQRKDGPLRQHSGAAGSLQADPLELFPLHVLHPVMLRELFIHERVVRIEEVEHRPILTHDVLEERLRFLLHRRAQRVVVSRERLCIRRSDAQVAQLEPLPAKILHQRARLRVLEHSFHLPIKVLVQLPLLRQREQLRIRHRAPEEVRQPRREREVVDGMNGLRVVWFRLKLAPEEEVRRHQHGLQRELNTALERVALFHRHIYELHQPFDLVSLGWTPEGASGEPGDHFTRVLHLVRRRSLAEENAPMRLRQRGQWCVERTGDFEVIDDQIPVATLLRILVRAVNEVVEVSRGESIRAGRELEPHLIDLRLVGLDGHLERLEVLLVQAELHLRRPRSELLAVSEGAQCVFARLSHREANENIAFTSQLFCPTVHEVGRRRAIQLTRRKAPDARLGRIFRDNGGFHDLLRCREILLHQYRRHRQHITDVVEAVAGIIRRKIIRRLERHADQIANRVVVFRAVQPPERHAAGIRIIAVTGEHLRLDPFGNQLHLFDLGLLLFFRRHGVAADVFQHFLPGLGVVHGVGLHLVNIQHKVSLLFAVAVTAVAILVEQRDDLFLVGNLAVPGVLLASDGLRGSCFNRQQGQQRRRPNHQ